MASAFCSEVFDYFDDFDDFDYLDCIDRKSIGLCDCDSYFSLIIDVRYTLLLKVCDYKEPLLLLILSRLLSNRIGKVSLLICLNELLLRLPE